MPSDHIRESIENARQYLSEHPDEARYGDHPATAVIENGLRCRVEHATGAALVTDMPGAVGGEGSAPTPGWFARAAQASCDGTLIAMRAAELGVPLQSLEVTVDSESDDRGLSAWMTRYRPARSVLASGSASQQQGSTRSACESWSNGPTTTRLLQMPFDALYRQRLRLSPYSAKLRLE
jgi:hypothetical protein